MVMAWFLSVVIDINIRRAIVKTENHPPVGPNSHGPKAFHLTFERMQPKPRQVHMTNSRRGVKRRQNTRSFSTCSVFTPLGSSCSNSRFSPLWPIVFTSRTVTRHVSHVKNNGSKIPVFF